MKIWDQLAEKLVVGPEEHTDVLRGSWCICSVAPPNPDLLPPQILPVAHTKVENSEVRLTDALTAALPPPDLTPTSFRCRSWGRACSFCLAPRSPFTWWRSWLWRWRGPPTSGQDPPGRRAVSSALLFSHLPPSCLLHRLFQVIVRIDDCLALLNLVSSVCRPCWTTQVFRLHSDAHLCSGLGCRPAWCSSPSCRTPWVSVRAQTRISLKGRGGIKRSGIWKKEIFKKLLT